MGTIAAPAQLSLSFDAVPYGYCHCGCGRETRKPHYRFLRGHSGRTDPYQRVIVVDCGYKTPCRLWTGPLDKDGYGHTSTDKGPIPAHRWFYLRERGPIPDGLELDHLCRIRHCTDSSHVDPVTRAMNSYRGACAKLNAGIVQVIRQSSRSGVALSLEYGVSKGTISMIRSGKIWKEV